MHGHHGELVCHTKTKTKKKNVSSFPVTNFLWTGLRSSGQFFLSSWAVNLLTPGSPAAT